MRNWMMSLLFWLALPLQAATVYHPQPLALTVPDGRHDAITLLVPDATAPASGFPVLYALDGNAALAALTDHTTPLTDGAPVVIVTLGYQGDRPFDVAARAWDYLPQPANGDDPRDPLNSAWRNGGADDFLTFIAQQVMPAVAAQVNIDSRQQTLWGHSYGGVLVMHALLTRPTLFDRYVAADPALWWRDGQVYRAAQAFAANPPAMGNRQLLLMHASGVDAEREARRTPEQRAMLEKLHSGVPDDVALMTARTLAQVPGLAVHYRDYPQLTHGPLLPVSLGPAVRLSRGQLND